jgi:MFS family permease
MSFLKEKLNSMRQHLTNRVRQSSPRQRIVALAPLVTALVFAGLTMGLNIFLWNVSVEQALFNFFNSFSILAVFFAGIAWTTPILVSRHFSRLEERRAVDVLWLGLYIPQAIATLVILYTQLSGSENVTDLSAAIIMWAMLSLILTPFSVILTFIAWTFVPKDLPKFPSIGRPKVSALVKASKTISPKVEILEPITELTLEKPVDLAKNENEKPVAADMGSRLNRVGLTRR